MRFRVLASEPGRGSVLDSPDAFRSLEDLLRRCTEARHDLEFVGLGRIDETAWWSWLRDEERGALEDLRLKALAGAWGSAARRPVIAEHEIADAMTAAQARALSLLPLVVLVEDVLRDGSALEAIVILLGSPALADLVEVPPVPPSVEFRHSGGTGNMAKLAAEAVATFRRHAGGARVLCVMDSDDPRPGSCSPARQGDVDRIRDLAPDAHVHVHAQRAMENYLPRTYWQQALMRFSPNQAIDDLLETADVDCDSLTSAASA